MSNIKTDCFKQAFGLEVKKMSAPDYDGHGMLWCVASVAWVKGEAGWRYTNAAERVDISDGIKKQMFWVLQGPDEVVRMLGDSYSPFTQCPEALDRNCQEATVFRITKRGEIEDTVPTEAKLAAYSFYGNGKARGFYYFEPSVKANCICPTDLFHAVMYTFAGVEAIRMYVSFAPDARSALPFEICRNLKSVTMIFETCVETIPEAFLFGLSSSCRNLDTLVIQTETGFTDNAIDALATHLALKEFLFTYIQPTTLTGAEHLTKMATLDYLSITVKTQYPRTTHGYGEDTMLKIISDGLPPLTKFRLTGNRGVTDTGLIDFVKHQMHLKHLSYEMVDLTGDVLQNIAVYCPQLEVFDMGRCPNYCPSDLALYHFVNHSWTTLKKFGVFGRCHFEELYCCLRESFAELDIRGIRAVYDEGAGDEPDSIGTQEDEIDDYDDMAIQVFGAPYEGDVGFVDDDADNDADAEDDDDEDPDDDDDDGEQTPTNDGGATPPDDGSSTPTNDGGETPSVDGGETPATVREVTPAVDGEETPSVDDGETPATVGGVTPAVDGVEETPKIEDEEAPSNNGVASKTNSDEAPKEAAKDRGETPEGIDVPN